MKVLKGMRAYRTLVGRKRIEQSTKTANSDGLIFGQGSARKFLYEQPIDNALVDASIEFTKIMDLNG